MYKSVGLSNRQNMKMALIEGFSSGLIGAIIAIVVSYLEIQTIFLVAGPKISMSPHLELSTFLSAGLMGIGVTLLGSAVPVSYTHLDVYKRQQSYKMSITCVLKMQSNQNSH